MSRTERPKTKLVPVPATNIIPERDISLPPILEARHLGIDFGGLCCCQRLQLRHWQN